MRQKEPATKTLISIKTKKSVDEPVTKSSDIESQEVHQAIEKPVTSKTCKNLQGVFITTIGFVTLGHLFELSPMHKRWSRGQS